MVEFLQKAERFSKNWVKLSGNIRGIVWLSIGAFLFSITDVIVKLLGRKFDPMELALFRYGIGMIILTPIFLKMGLENLKTKKIGLHIIRMLLAMLAQVGIFITVINIPLADATAIFFSKPLFTTIIAVFFRLSAFLGESKGLLNNFCPISVSRLEWKP